MNNSDMQQNLYRILRMNIILAKSSGEIVTEDTLQSFDEAAKKIDEAANAKYDEDIKGLYYATTTLEEEAKRLDKLIAFIDKRLEDRKNLLIDYRETTNRNLEALGYIKDEEKVNEYKYRLNNIRAYLSNKENITKIEEELKELHANLDECYSNKQKDESNNFELEDDLLLTFKNIVSGSSYSDILVAVDIDFELEKLRPSVDEAKKTLGTFEVAFSNLKKSGISFDSEMEYSSYVEEAKKAYYFVKEKEFLFGIYKIIIDSKNVYGELATKRDSLDKILEERLHLRVEVGIFEDDLLNDLYAIIEKQNQIIAKEKENIDKIGQIEDSIKFKETRLNELKQDNQKVEILSLLQEFGIIDTYKSDVVVEHYEEKVDEVEVPMAKEPVIEEQETENNASDEEIKLPNMIVEVKDAYDNLNLSFAKSKADTVMRRVGRSLGYAPEVKKETITTFDFNKSKEEVKMPEVKVDDTVEIAKPNDMELKQEVSAEGVNTNVNVDVNDNNGITLPSIEASANNQIDEDFWSFGEGAPAIDPNKDYAIEQNQTGFKLGSPVEFGGNNESGN